MTAAEFAARYAAQGWPIFPVKARGKDPLTLTGFKAASADPAQVAKWWETWPDANIGCAPSQTGHLVIDIDGPAGEQAARALGLLSEPTLTVTTARGRHLWFQHPGGTIGNVTLAPHLDVRADHGYVLLPPSVHPTGAVYRWQGKLDEAKPLPPDVIARLNGHGPAHAAPPVPERIPKGQRNIMLTSLAGSMRRRGANEAEILAALEVMNARCDEGPLDADELAKIAHSIARYEPSNPPPAPKLAPAPSDNGRTSACTPMADTLTHIRELLAEPDDAVSWIVDGLLPAGGLSVFGGKPKGGKSTTARAIALRVCRGEPVLGRPTTQGPVIYLGLEDPRRVTKGHLRRLGAQAEDDLYVFTGSRPAEALVWLETILTQVDPVLVVVDTLQHLLGVSDLNDYARVVAALGPVLGLVRSRRAHLLLVHHAGKGDRTGFDAILGSTAIVGTVDVALLLRRREDKTRTLETLQRTGEDLPESVLVLDDRQEPRIEGTRKEYDARQVEGRVTAWLEGQVEPVTRKAVEEGVEGRAELVRAALYRLVEAKRVTRTGAGEKGDPYLFQRACPVSPDIPGHADTHPKTGDSSPDSATLACPANPGFLQAPPTPGTRILSLPPEAEPERLAGADGAVPVLPRLETEPCDGGCQFGYVFGRGKNAVTVTCQYGTGALWCTCPDYRARRDCEHCRQVERDVAEARGAQREGA